MLSFHLNDTFLFLILEVSVEFGRTTFEGSEMPSNSVVGKFRSFYSTIDQVGIRYSVSGIRYFTVGIDVIWLLAVTIEKKTDPIFGRYPVSDIRYPVSDIRYPVSSIWYPVSGTFQ